MAVMSVTIGGAVMATVGAMATMVIAETMATMVIVEAMATIATVSTWVFIMATRIRFTSATPTSGTTLITIIPISRAMVAGSIPAFMYDLVTIV